MIEGVKLDIDEILRQLLPGVLVVGLHTYCSGTSIDLLRFVFTAYVIGSLIYILHRGIIFPIILKGMLVYVNKKLNLLFIEKYGLVITLDIYRLKNKALSNLKMWASFIHLSYCITWSILSFHILVMLDIISCCSCIINKYQYTYFAVGAIFLINAIVNNYAYAKRELIILLDDTEKNKESADSNHTT